jgi:hypothetical protein
MLMIARMSAAGPAAGLAAGLFLPCMILFQKNEHDELMLCAHDLVAKYICILQPSLISAFWIIYLISECNEVSHTYSLTSTTDCCLHLC